MTTTNRGTSDEPAWRPTRETAAATQLARFSSAATTLSGHDLSAYEDLHSWSINQPAAFWQLVWDFTRIQASQAPAQPVADLQLFPGACWFPNARLNFAENLLRFRDDQTALICILETGERRELTYAELFAQTAVVAGHLKSNGIGPADRVVGWLPNIAETVIAMLATTSLGAVWSSCSPDLASLARWIGLTRSSRKFYSLATATPTTANKFLSSTTSTKSPRKYHRSTR